MSDAHFLLFRRPEEQTVDSFASGLRSTAQDVAAGGDATTVVLYVDDGNVGAPERAHRGPQRYSGAMLVAGVPSPELPQATAIFAVTRRVIKARERGRDGERSAGFTDLFLVHRAEHLDHDQFNDHWRESHSHVHVQSSPGTRHYEQFLFDQPLTPGAPDWDGVTVLSFGSLEDATERLYGPGGKARIAADSVKFVHSPTETFPTSEFVYLDDATEAMYRDTDA